MDVMAKSPSKLSDKIVFLTKRENIPNTEIARAIGVSPQQYGYYLTGAVPGFGALAKLAELFKVPLEWFADDSSPASKPPRRLQYVEHDQLMQEAAIRYSERYLKIMGFLDRAEAVNWKAFDKNIQDFNPSSRPTPELQACLDVLFIIKANFLQDILDPCDSVSLAFRISKLSNGQLPVEAEVGMSPEREYLFKRIDAIHRQALTTEHAHAIFRWSMARGFWAEQEAIFDSLDKALQACGV